MHSACASSELSFMLEVSAAPSASAAQTWKIEAINVQSFIFTGFIELKLQVIIIHGLDEFPMLPCASLTLIIKYHSLQVLLRGFWS